MRVDSAGTGALVDSAADSTAMRIAKSLMFLWMDIKVNNLAQS